MWYVIQVTSGKEEQLAARILQVVPVSVLQECFYPRFATEMKVRGAFIPVEKPLFPGYLIAIAKDPRALDRALIDMQDFARVLKQGEDYVPLDRPEMELIDSFTGPGKRVVPMGTGVKEGDDVVVTRGPLVGRQAMIQSINRRKSIAVLEFNLCGRKVRTRVGLAVLSAPQSARARRAQLYVEEARKSASKE